MYQKIGNNLNIYQQETGLKNKIHIHTTEYYIALRKREVFDMDVGLRHPPLFSTESFLCPQLLAKASCPKLVPC